MWRKLGSMGRKDSIRNRRKRPEQRLASRLGLRVGRTEPSLFGGLICLGRKGTPAGQRASVPSLMSGRTSIVIAHRFSNIRDADIIVGLERRKLAEVGTHDEMMARRGLYFYFSSQQIGL